METIGRSENARPASPVSQRTCKNCNIRALTLTYSFFFVCVCVFFFFFGGGVLIITTASYTPNASVLPGILESEIRGLCLQCSGLLLLQRPGLGAKGFGV